jgi:hypothetical protein
MNVLMEEATGYYVSQLTDLVAVQFEIRTGHIQNTRQQRYCWIQVARFAFVCKSYHNIG